MNTIKKELAVAALENGTVIDHIPTSALFKVVTLLGLPKLKVSVTIGNNLDSKEMGSKGIIKIADTYYPEDVLNRIAVIAPTAKINIIKNFNITEKYAVKLPDDLTDIIKCNNPKCVFIGSLLVIHFEMYHQQ